MIGIDEKNIAAITAHGERDYPHECGGMLIGHFGTDGRKTVVETFPLGNAREEEARHNRVLILPGDVLKAERYARERKLDVIGYYHSHPESPAVPSQYDLDHAWPTFAYIIVAVAQGAAGQMTVWFLKDDRSRFEEGTLHHGENSHPDTAQAVHR